MHDNLTDCGSLPRGTLRFSLCFLTIPFLSACGSGAGEDEEPTDFIAEAARQYGIEVVNADELNDIGGTGEGVRVAVVDSGIDASHSEFSGRGLNGRNFVGSNIDDWDLDNARHGTWVAGVIGAARDGRGMRGVAYDADLFIYRVNNSGNDFEGIDTNEKFADMIDSHRDANDDIHISNNSWDYVCQMDGDDPDCISIILSENFEDTVLEAFQEAVGDGTVFVWSAGNIFPEKDSDELVELEDYDSPNLMAGLPAFYSGISNNWLAVMAVDENGMETGFSQRCGDAADWCVAAPGKVILTTDAGGGYEYVSGTSFAAPIVSGVLAILVDQLSITPEQAVTRVKATATYEGLEGFSTNGSGCTIDTCDEAAMAAIFGHGLVDASAAQQPLSSLAVPLSGSTNGRSAAIASLSAPQGLSSRGRKQLAEAQVLALDTFDGAAFSRTGGDIFAETEANTRSIGYLSTGPEARIRANRIDPAADDRLSFAHVYATQGVSPASVDFWGDKVGLVKDLDSDRLQTDSVQVAYALNDFLTVAGNVDYSPVTQETGFGLSAQLHLGTRTRLMGGISQGAHVEDVTGVDTSSMTISQATRYELGIRHALTDRIELFGHAEMREVDDISASTTRWGTDGAAFGSAVLGAEYGGSGYKLSAGLYHPDQQIDGEATIYLATARSIDGQVFYREEGFDASGDGDLGLFLAGKWDLLENGMGELAFQIQQMPGAVETVDKAAVSVNFRF